MRKSLIVLAMALLMAATANVAVAQTTSTDPLGNVWIRANFGAGEANWYIDQLAKGDVSMVQYAIDHYYTNCSDGTSNRWGNGWLSEYVVYMLGMRAYDLRAQLSTQTLDELDSLLADSFHEEVFRLDMSCGLDSWNSCSEDFGGNSQKYSLRTIYPKAAEIAGGQEKLMQLEEKYLELEYSTTNGYYSLVKEISPIDGRVHVVIHNHGEQSAVYANILNTDVGNALYVYALAGQYPPSFYTEPQVAEPMGEMMRWIQLTALPDGSAFLANGCMNYKGENGPCNDPAVANTIPTFVPGGRAPMILLGSGAFTEGLWKFIIGDPSCDTGNSWNMGRKLEYHAYNLMPLDIGLTASVSGSEITLQWQPFDGATGYDVWGPSGRITSINSTSYSFSNAPAGTFEYGVAVCGESGRILGVSFGSVEVPHIVRRHIKSLPITTIVVK